MALTEFRLAQSTLIRPFVTSVLRLLGLVSGKPLNNEQRKNLVATLTDTTNTARTTASNNAWTDYLSNRPDDAPEIGQPTINALPPEYFAKVLDTHVEDLESEEHGVGAAARIAQTAVRSVENAARETTIAAVRYDPVAEFWARVPVGETCGWCLMLCSRGAVYSSKEAALTRTNKSSATGNFDEFHLNCNCAVVPKFRGTRYEGQDHNEALQQLWEDATDGKRGKNALKAFSEAVKNGAADHAKDARKPVGSRDTDNTPVDNAPRLAQIDAQLSTLTKTLADLESRDGTSRENPKALAYQRRMVERLRNERAELSA